jgi:hypothetical protein
MTKTKTKQEPIAEAAPVIQSIKGLNSKFQCRNFQFEIGKTYTVSGRIKACENGFHACPDHPFDVWEYYSLTGEDGSISRYALVEQSGKTDRNGNKVASASITIKAEISLPDFIRRGVEYILAQVNWKDAKESNTGDRSAATNAGDQSAATNTGYRSAATNTGYRSAATNTGYQSAATNAGDQSAATNTGDRSAATNTGDRSAATNTGYQSAATVDGKHSVAVATGIDGRAKACATSGIVLSYRDPDNEYAIKHLFAAMVGERGIKADTWYTLNSEGEPVAA